MVDAARIELATPAMVPLATFGRKRTVGFAGTGAELDHR